MEKWDDKYFQNPKINEENFKKALIIQEKLNKLDLLAKDVFSNYKIASRIFAFIESKYSSKIEGIYTTLFENINTNANKEKKHLIEPLINALFKEKKIIDKKQIIDIAKTINQNLDEKKRWSNEFGVYRENKKIYEPCLKKEKVTLLINNFFNKIKNDQNIIDIIIFHILFEKIHPFVDANGRIGRLILQKQIIKKISFLKLIPLSWAIYKKSFWYYEALDEAKKDINISISLFFDIFDFFIKTTTNFINDIDHYYQDNQEKILSYSNKVSLEMAKDILLSIQTKKNFIEKKYKLNPRTIEKIFNHLINQDFNFNIKIISKKKLYWNIELETIIEKHFNN